MKTFLRTIALGLLVVCLTVPALADAQQSTPQQGTPRPGGLRQALQLTPAQEEQLQPIIGQFRQKTTALRQAFQAKLQAVLTPQQVARLERVQVQLEQGGSDDRRDTVVDLNLTSGQVEQLRAFHAQQKAELQMLVEQFVAQVKAILTPQQQATFDRFILERQQATGGDTPLRPAPVPASPPPTR